MDGMEFFQRSAGQWRSQRTTHHLPFRRAEIGDSEIYVESLGADHPRIVEICEMHQFDPNLAIGGAFVSWDGSMAWDKENENHEGNTVFALIPDPNNPRQGKLLRERGYAEIMPVAGEYHLDDDNALVMLTEYETMSIFERFWFITPDLRIRASTVQRFGGFNTATFCAEIRSNDSESFQVASDTPPNRKFFAISGW